MFPDTGMARVTDWVLAFSGSALKVVQVVPSRLPRTIGRAVPVERRLRLKVIRSTSPTRSVSVRSRTTESPLLSRYPTAPSGAPSIEPGKRPPAFVITASACPSRCPGTKGSKEIVGPFAQIRPG